METVFAGLPFYDSLEKTDRVRTGARVPFNCPRHQLLPFQINVGTDNPGAITRIDLLDCKNIATEITSYFAALPALFTTTANDYFQYKGNQLATPLPRGQWKVKLTTANGYIYYSENIVVSDIYQNLITGWVNAPIGGYDTFTTTGTIISSAITDGSDIATVYSPMFAIRKGESIFVKFNYLLNSGTAAVIYLQDFSLGVGSSVVNLVSGINNITLTALYSASEMRVIIQNSAAASNFLTSEVFVYRSYSPRFIRIDMSNAKDLGNILYQDGWAQTLFLETRLNYPTTEVVEVGDEKDGIFNVEKIVTKYIYRISTYINRAMHRVLSRISQHSSVTITDEVGNTYTPSIGNIRMEADQPHFETTHAVISFNDGENTAYDWTYDMENMT